MGRTDNFRDYLYVSARKVARMSRTLPPGRLRRVRGAQVNLGPLGAGVTLDQDSRAEDVIALVPEVERAIEQRFGIRSLTEPELQVGHWFKVTGVPMTYGVAGFNVDGLLFLGEKSGRRFILGGSPEYLLDRQVDEPRRLPGLPRSTLAGIRELMEQLARRERSDVDDDEGDPTLADALGWSAERAAGGWGLGGLRGLRNAFGLGEEPLSTVARCLDLETSEWHGYTVVIGTPLYVAFHVPA